MAIRQIVAQSDADPATVCEHAVDEALEQLGGEDCAKQVVEADDGEPAKIESLAIEGDTATMATDNNTSTFERDESGAWVLTTFE